MCKTLSIREIKKNIPIDTATGAIYVAEMLGNTDEDGFKIVAKYQDGMRIIIGIYKDWRSCAFDMMELIKEENAI